MRHRTGIRNIVFALALFLVPWSVSSPQTPGVDLVSQAWKAWWIAHPDGPRREFGVFHFRKTFTLDSVPQRFVIHVSGDNRYELFVNGERVLAGPARGDLNYWRYETLDIAPHLIAGRNLLAAVVWNFAELAPVAQVTNETGLIVQGDSERGTDRQHRQFLESSKEPGRQPDPVESGEARWVSGERPRRAGGRLSISVGMGNSGF